MPNLASVGRFIAHNPGAVAGIGAGVGAAANVGREALSGGENKNYLGAAIHGAAAGGVLGGGVGGIARAARDTHLLRPELEGAGNIAKATMQRGVQGASNFAHRQLHGLTGYGAKDTAYLDRIGIQGTQSAKSEIDLMKRRFMDEVPAGGHSHAQIMAHEAAKAPIRAQGALGERMRGLGMTSAPGAVKAMATNPRESSKAIWDQLRSGGKLGVTAGLGIPVAASAASLAKGDERAQGGQGVGEKVLRAGANIGGGLMFGGLPIASSMIAGGLTEAAAGRVGRAISPPHTQPTSGKLAP